MEQKETQRRDKLLLMVDCQNDFILEGASMCVPDAQAKMEGLEKYLSKSTPFYEGVAMTADWHPADHCSFKEQGGPWPSHCVANTIGARQWISWSKLRELMAHGACHNSQYIVLTKGKDKDKEEYGADAVGVINALADSACFPPHRVIHHANIDVVGIMSEYCVLETVRNLVSYIKKYSNAYLPDGVNERTSKIRLLLPFISTADNHQKLLQFAGENTDIIEVVEEIK